MKMIQCLMLPLLAGGAEIKRPPVFDGLYSYEKVMLVCGVILFLLLAAAFVYFIVQKRNPASLSLFFIFPIVMIGFPAVQKVSFDKESDKLNQQARYVKENPGDSTARKALTQTVEKMASRPSGNPEVWLRLATANEALGRQKQAEAQLDKALRIQPNLPAAIQMRSRLQQHPDVSPVRPNRPVMEPNR
jgi:tetratricopeptide (TPR) repeat protein